MLCFHYSANMSSAKSVQHPHHKKTKSPCVVHLLRLRPSLSILFIFQFVHLQLVHLPSCSVSICPSLPIFDHRCPSCQSCSSVPIFVHLVHLHLCQSLSIFVHLVQFVLHCVHICLSWSLCWFVLTLAFVFPDACFDLILKLALVCLEVCFALSWRLLRFVFIVSVLTFLLLV